MSAVALLLAAGRGQRLGDRGPKALVEVAGRSLLEHALEGLRRAGLTEVVVVHPDGAGEAFAARAPGTTLVVGGATRTESARAGLAVATDADLVAVHDAARAFMPSATIVATLAAVTGDVVAAAPACAVTDTLKRVEGAQVVGTIERGELVAVQTPQVFRREVLELALGRDGEASDDLALVERLIDAGEVSGRIVTVPGSSRGLKVTWPDDVRLAEVLRESVT